MGRDALRLRLDELYRHYDHRFVTPDPLELVRAQAGGADREVTGLVASGLAFGTVAQIKCSISTVLETLGPRPAEAVAALDPSAAADRLRGFRHRWISGTLVCGLSRRLRMAYARRLSQAIDAECLHQDFRLPNERA